MILRYSVDTRALKIAMIDLGINSNVALARAAGISSRTVNSIMKGQNPTNIAMCKIATALGLNGQQAAAIFFVKKLRNT